MGRANERVAGYQETYIANATSHWLESRVSLTDQLSTPSHICTPTHGFGRPHQDALVRPWWLPR